MERVSLKEDGSNISDWEAQLKNSAEANGKLKFLTEPLPVEPPARATAQIRASYDEHLREACAIKNVLIFAMHPTLQRRFITSDANKIFNSLSTMFSKAPKILPVRCRHSVL